MDIINLDYLKLMADGDQDMVTTMLDMLMEELPSEFEKMKNLHATQDWAELGKVSHKMKSTLAFIGNNDLTQANLTVEQLTKKRDEPLRLDELENMGASMARFEALLPNVIAGLQATAAGY